MTHVIEVNIKLLGDVGVGKTTLFNRFIHDRFVSESAATFSTDISTKRITVKSLPVNLIIQDTRGFENAGSMMPSNMFRSVDVLLFVYDMSSNDTLYNITSWESHVRDLVDVRKIIVGNKIDLEESNETIQKYLQRAKDFYSTKDSFEVSAKVGTQCSELLNEIAEFHISKHHKQRSTASTGCVTFESFPFEGSSGGRAIGFTNQTDSNYRQCCKIT